MPAYEETEFAGAKRSTDEEPSALGRAHDDLIDVIGRVQNAVEGLGRRLQVVRNPNADSPEPKPELRQASGGSPAVILVVDQTERLRSMHRHLQQILQDLEV